MNRVFERQNLRSWSWQIGTIWPRARPRSRYGRMQTQKSDKYDKQLTINQRGVNVLRSARLLALFCTSCWQSRYVVRSSEDSDTRLLFQVLVHGRDPPPNSGGASATVPLPAAAGEHSHTPSCDSGYASVLCLLLLVGLCCLCVSRRLGPRSRTGIPLTLATIVSAASQRGLTGGGRRR